MKKSIIAFTVFVLAVSGNSIAQTGGMHVAAGDLNFSAAKMKEGSNSVIIKEGKGVLQFVKKGDTYAEVIYKNEAGKSTRLSPSSSGVNGTARPLCNTRPAASFTNTDKTIGLCICSIDQPGAGGYIITLDLPDGTTGKAQNRRVEVKLSK